MQLDPKSVRVGFLQEQRHAYMRTKPQEEPRTQGALTPRQCRTWEDNVVAIRARLEDVELARKYELARMLCVPKT
jgi:hypothetical protein